MLIQLGSGDRSRARSAASRITNREVCRSAVLTDSNHPSSSSDRAGPGCEDRFAAVSRCLRDVRRLRVAGQVEFGDPVAERSQVLLGADVGEAVRPSLPVGVMPGNYRSHR